MTPPPAAHNETNGHNGSSSAMDAKAHAEKLMKAVPVKSEGSGHLQERFNPKTYAPDMKFSSPVVKERLAQSILHEFSPEEQAARIELAACYRLFAKWGWNEAIYNHLTAQIVDEKTGKHCFLINPMGLLYEEVTASSLLKIDLEGNILHHGVIGDIFGVNKAGFVIHGAIHAARHDLKAVMHCHFAPSAGVSAIKQGFQELAQTSHICGPITYHDYEGLVVDMDEQKRLVEDLGEHKVMFLRNHGIITCGASIAEAWYLHYVLLKACEIQVAAGAAACDRQSLLLPAEETIIKTMEVAKRFSGSQMGVKELSAYMRLIDREDDSYRN